MKLDMSLVSHFLILFWLLLATIPKTDPRHSFNISFLLRPMAQYSLITRSNSSKKKKNSRLVPLQHPLSGELSIIDTYTTSICLDWARIWHVTVV